jgi:hypothetical protein
VLLARIVVFRNDVPVWRQDIDIEMSKRSIVKISLLKSYSSYLSPRFASVVKTRKLSSDICGFLVRGAVSDERTGLLLGLARALTLGSKSHRTRDNILLSYLRLRSLFSRGLRLAGLRWRYSNPSPRP